MGLFSKKNAYEAVAMELEEAQQRRRDRSHSGSQSQGHAPSQPKSPAAPAAQTKPQTSSSEASKPNPMLSYGIEDVIQLMRDLPDSKKEMVILIVQKTLVSAKIDIKTILEKAARKIENLQSKNDKLRAEIRDLEELIIQKKSDVDRVRREMEETQQVRQSFEAVYLRGTRSSNPMVQDEESTLNRLAVNLEHASS